MTNKRFIYITLAFLFLGTPVSAWGRDTVENLADALPYRAKVMLVSEGSKHIHPICGCVLKADWGEDEARLTNKLRGDLNDEENRHKDVELMSWGDPAYGLDRKQREVIVNEAREDGASHVLFFSSRSDYRWNSREWLWVRNSFRWNLHLVDTETKHAKTFRGGDGKFRLLEPPLAVSCPRHDN